jgi:hypothetical protein
MLKFACLAKLGCACLCDDFNSTVLLLLICQRQLGHVECELLRCLGLELSSLHLALNAVVYGVQHCINGNARLVRRLSALLVHTSLDQDAVPVILSVLVVLVGAPDITLRGITNKVDRVGRGIELVLVSAPSLEQTSGELKSTDLWLAKCVCLKGLALGNLLEGVFDNATESTHAKANIVMSSGPDNIIVGEVNWWTLLESFRKRTDLTALGHGKVDDDLEIAGPVAGVGKYKDSLDGDIAEVSLFGVAQLLRGKLTERSRGAVGLDNVTRSHDILEAVTFGDGATFLTLTANDKHGAVLGGHLRHGCVAANELSGRDINLELLGEISAALSLGLTTAIGQEDIRTAAC